MAGCVGGKRLLTAEGIKEKVLPVRRRTSGEPIFTNGAQTGAFSYLFNDALTIGRELLTDMAAKLRTQVTSIRQQIGNADDLVSFFGIDPIDADLNFLSFDRSLRSIDIRAASAEIPGRLIRADRIVLDELFTRGLSRTLRTLTGRNPPSASFSSIPIDTSGVGIVCNPSSCDFTLEGNFDSLRNRLGPNSVRLR